MFNPFIQLLLLSFLVCFNLSGNLPKQEEVALVMNMKDERKIPRDFRTTNHPMVIQEGTLIPSDKGLKTLRISGSRQFSEQSLEAILAYIDHPKEDFYLVDLRQESHGFINGDAVSWYGDKDWLNVGKPLNMIEREEKGLLAEALKQQSIEVFDVVKVIENGKKIRQTKAFSLVVKSVLTEEQLAAMHKIHYWRLPVTDHVRPSDDAIDHFIAFVQQLPDNAWLHFHCKAGVGRTTTFMAMYDMIKNAKEVSYEDIILRQWFIGGRDLRKVSAHTPWKQAVIVERIHFLEEFYRYCHSNPDGFKTSWSRYLLDKKIAETETTETSSN